MSLHSGTTSASPKRTYEDNTASGNTPKRIKPDPGAGLDDQYGNLFDPLPFETKGGFPGGDFPIDEKFELPGLLGNPEQSRSTVNMVATPGASVPNTNINTSNTHINTSTGSMAGTAGIHTPATDFPYQRTVGTGSYTGAYRPGTTTTGPATGSSTYRPARFDPKRTAADGKAEDPLKLNDALAAAGVDIQREEELLLSNYGRSAYLIQQQAAARQRQTYGPFNAFLHPYHVALAMNRVARDNGVVQNFMVDPEMLDFMSAACKEWLSGIVTRTVALSRHRRRGIPALAKTLAGKPKPIPPSQRSEVAKELRNLALRQRENEERRVAKRLALGLEKTDDVAPESGNKVGAEETLHRAANATAAMMTMNPRKKYLWMTSGAGTDTKTGPSKDGGPKQSALLAMRGDNGLRFREIRTGNMITTKDLLGVLEEERVGTAKAVTKGYARLKD